MSSDLSVAESRGYDGIKWWDGLPVKRVLDVVLILIASWLILPLACGVAFAVAVFSGGPVLFAHERVGRGGQPFMCWKFRTMVSAADALIRSDEALLSEFMKGRKLARDPRVTPIGRFLRRTSLDEIPQFWNVLRGDMSIVGPRPVVAEELEAMYGNAARAVTAVPPGLTGLWQISGRSTLNYADRVRLDIHYAAGRTLLLDLSILLATPIAVLKGRGAH